MARIDHFRDGKWVRSLELSQQRTYLVGRDPAADLVLKDPLCSRRHLHIDWVDGAFVMKDLETSNGTTVDGVREYKRRLSSKVTIQIGKDMLLFQPEPEGVEPSPDDTLPDWAFRSLDEPSMLMPATGMMAPAALQRLQARTRLRTRPHLVRRIKGEDPQIFALDLDVTPIGWGAVRVSLGPGKEKVVAEVHKTKNGYRIKAKGLFAKVSINGASKRDAVLKGRDRIEVDRAVLEFHPGLEGKGG
jgi:pSer/pThr/pTyr-binding forkhead associated (FHA) protein